MRLNLDTMMRVEFPEIRLPAGLVLGTPLATPRDWIANSKAVAAQPFARADTHARYHESGLWRNIASMFVVQYAATPPLQLELESADSLQFAWALQPDIAIPGCIVWVTDVPVGLFVKHIRVYATLEAATTDNARIRAELASID